MKGGNKREMKQRVKWKAAGILLSFAVLLAAAVPAQAAGEQVKASIPVAQKFSVSGGDDSVNSEFTYQLTPLEKENPMPEGSAQGMWSFQMVGNIETETKAITFDHAGVYAYQLRMAEEAEQEGYFFDEEVYRATFFVRNTQTGLAAELILQNSAGEKVSSAVFENGYEYKTGTGGSGDQEKASTVKTGDPVQALPFFLAAGALAVIVLVTVYKKRSSDSGKMN